MKNLRFKVIRRYKKAEAFLKNHPFWPSFLSNGGILTIFLIASIIFTVICGRNSTRDILPELKVLDLRFSGNYETWLNDINIFHNIHLPGLEENHNDRISFGYGSTCYERDTIYDDRAFLDKVNAYYNLGIDADSVIVSKMSIKTFDTYTLLETRNNIGLLANPKSSMPMAVMDSLSPTFFSHNLICPKDSLRSERFRDTFDGNFISTNKRNPYIYLNFILDGDFRYHPEESTITFIFSEKDGMMSETKAPVNILSVFPEPTYQSPSCIIYEGDDLKKVIENNGFTFLGEDLSVKQKSDKRTFLWTVLFGTAIAITIDILVNLIIKWRDIVPRRKRRK